jgi:isopentenyl-diphosphate delta-isomerase type 1
MKATQLLKTILPGMLPLLVFIIVDEIWGTEIGLFVAVGFGIIQLFIVFFKEKRFDKFVFFDTLLIVVLGAVSLLLENDIFFKLKPAIIGFILVAMLGISAFSSKNILVMMSERYLKGVQINEQQQKAMLRSIRIMFWIFLTHTLLVVYSAFFMTKQAWAFISGVLFYLAFAVFFIFEFVRNLYLRRKKTSEEMLAHIDENGKIIGMISRTEAHDGSKKLHPVIHCHIINSKGEVLLQKRNSTKKIQPGKWDTAVGGHISYGEELEKALERETKEELGLKNLKFNFITKYIWKSEIEAEQVFVFIAEHEEFLVKPNSEVDAVKFWSFDEIKANTAKSIFTPNFEMEFEKILSPMKKRINRS